MQSPEYSWALMGFENENFYTEWLKMWHQV